MCVRKKELIHSLSFMFSFDFSQAAMKQKLLGGRDGDKERAGSICRLPVMPGQLRRAGGDQTLTKRVSSVFTDNNQTTT